MNHSTDIQAYSPLFSPPYSPQMTGIALDERGAANPTDNSSVYIQDADEKGIDWHRFAGILKRRRKVMALTAAGVLVAAGIYLTLAPKIYEASADLLINTSQKSSSQFASSLPAINDLVDATTTRSQDTEVEILRSSTVQDAAVALLPKKLRATVRNNIRVDIEPKRSTDIVTVSVQSREPMAAVAYSNALCEAYRLQNETNNTKQYGETAEYVGSQLAKVRRQLDQKRDELKRYKETNAIIDLTTETQASVARLNELEDALEQAQVDRASGEAQLTSLRAQAMKMAPAEVTPSTIVTRPVVQQLRERLTSLEAQRTDALQEFQAGSPEIRNIEDRIAALRRHLRTEATTEVGTYTRNVNPVRQGVMQTIPQTLANVWATQARENALKINIDRARHSVLQLPLHEKRLSQLQGDLMTYQQTFQSLSDKYQTLVISQKTPVANARIITPAAKAAKVSPRVASTMILSLLGGLVVALLAAIVIDSLDSRVYTEEDAVQITGLPLLTHVPMVPLKSEQKLLINQVDSSADSSALLESFRMLRTQLSFITSYGHLKTLVLTSSQPGEGKSTVAANLAIAMSLNGNRVVLVDTDLRRPSIHTIFKMDNMKGFTTVVTGECTLAEALRDTEYKGLQVLSSGRTPPNPPELLDSHASRSLIAQLKAQADYVIIDAPPALMLADAQVAATMADGVLLVVSCIEAKRNNVERTCELLARTGIRTVGMVLNKFTSQQGSSYGYYGYKYNPYERNLDAPGEQNHAL